MTCWKQYSIYVGWFLNTSSWKPWQRTSIRVGDNCRIGIHIRDQHFLLMFRLGSNWYQQTSYRCFRVSKKPSPSQNANQRFFPTHKPWLISGPHFYSRDPALFSSETASWLCRVPPSWCLSHFFWSQHIFLLLPVQPDPMENPTFTPNWEQLPADPPHPRSLGVVSSIEGASGDAILWCHGNLYFYFPLYFRLFYIPLLTQLYSFTSSTI